MSMHEVSDLIMRPIDLLQIDRDALFFPKAAPKILTKVPYSMDRRLLRVDEANSNLLQ